MGEAVRELEIKLVGAPADVADLLAAPVLAEQALGPPVHERLVSTYYDTPYRHLARAGASLRLRAEAAGTIQSVKLEPAGEGALARLEWERLLEPPARHPRPTGDPAFARVDALLCALAPVARVVSDRWTVDLQSRRARMEAAVDLGRLEFLSDGEAARVAPLAEFELELVSGKPRPMFKTARRLAAAAGGRLQVSVAAKAARALAAAGGGLPKERRLVLPEGGGALDVLGSAFRQYTKRIAELRPFVAELRAPEGAHLMRVALRRLRILARDYARDLGGKRLRRLAGRARVLARALAPARDFDVFIDGALAEARARAGGGEGFDLLAAGASRLRAEAWSAAAAATSSAEFAVFVLDLLEAGAREPWRRSARARLDHPATDFARRALDRRHEAALARGRGLAADDFAGRHRLRLAVKALRYGAQTFRPLFADAERRPFMQALSDLQEGLGALSDAEAALALAERAAKGGGAAAARAAGIVAGISAARAKDAAAEADRLWARFAALRPFWRDG